MPKIKPEYIGQTIWVGSPYSQNIVIRDDSAQFDYYRAAGLGYIFIEESQPKKRKVTADKE